MKSKQESQNSKSHKTLPRILKQKMIVNKNSWLFGKMNSLVVIFGAIMEIKNKVYTREKSMFFWPIPTIKSRLMPIMKGK